MDCSDGIDGGFDNNAESSCSTERPPKKKQKITDYFSSKTRDEESLVCEKEAEEVSDCGRKTNFYSKEESSRNNPKPGPSQEKPNYGGKSEEVGNQFQSSNDMVNKYKFTIYNLTKHRLEVQAGDGIEILQKSVEDFFNLIEGIDLHKTWQKYGDFHVIWYIYKIEIYRNKRSEMIAKDLAKKNAIHTTEDEDTKKFKTTTDDEDEDSEISEDESEGESLSNLNDRSVTDDRNEERDSIRSHDFVPGHRNTTNVLAVCKMTTDGPVVFCLLDGRQPMKLLFNADSEFPVKAANLLMDDSRIKKLDTLNIAGPAIKTSKSFLWSESSGMSFSGPNWSLNEIVTEATSSLSKSNQSISSILNSEGEDVKITIGQYFVRVEKKMPIKIIIEFLEYLIKEMDRSTDGNNVEFYNFGHVHKIEKRFSAEVYQTYQRNLKEKAISYFLDETLDTLFFLSVAQPYIRDWMTATKVVLTRNKVTIKEWPFAPSLADIRIALQKQYGKKLKNIFQSKTDIQLSFPTSNTTRKKNLFQYVHGSVADKNKGIVAHKVSGKWYSVTGEYSDIVDNSFLDLMKNVFINSKTDSSGYPKLPVPWRKTSTFTCEELAKAFHLDDPKLLDDVIAILSEETSFVKDDFICDLTEFSCLFPERSQIFKDISKGLCPKHLDGKPITKKDTYVHKVAFYLYDSIMQGRPCDWIKKSSPELQDELLKKRNIIVRVNSTNKFEVLNASLTTSMLNKLCQVSTKLEEEAVVTFLRSHMNLKEEEYNETYLLKNGFILGDQILVHNSVIELFDILTHEKDTKTTFLYHVKQGFGHDTRVSCSQIRVSAEVLWRDRIQGKNTHVDLFHKKAREGSDHSLRRTMLKNMFQTIDVEEFRNFFSIETKLVFVFAFVDDKKNFVLENIGPLNVSEFIRIAKESNTDAQNMIDGLKSEDILTNSGFLRDTFIDVTKKSFPDLLKKGKVFQSMTRDSLEKIYDILAKHRCSISTIPKVELLELDREFAHYQIGGKRKFEFKILQII